MINRFWWKRASEIALVIVISCAIFSAWLLFLNIADASDFDVGIFFLAVFTSFGTFMNMAVAATNISAQTSVSIALGGTRREALMGIQLLKLFSPLVIFTVAACAYAVLDAELLPLIPICLAIALALSAVSGMLGVLMYRKRTLGGIIMGIICMFIGGFVGFGFIGGGLLLIFDFAETDASLSKIIFSTVSSVSVYIWLAAVLLYILSVILESRMLRRFEVKL